MDELGLPEPRLITTPAALKKLAAELSRQRIIAVDTESNSLHAYREQVCLIQFSTPEADYLVDPLPFQDLSPLGEVFANAKIEKVFHAAEYDLICLRRDFAFLFANLFDTMVAASILGRNELGLGSILESDFGIRLNKRFQRANWGQRPLPRDLLAYAQLDTHYLIGLRDRLKSELQASERWPLAVEDFNRMTQPLGRSNDQNHKNAEDLISEGCWRISGVFDLTPQQAAVLMELCRYRDQVARSLDRPFFKVMGDATLLAIAATCPSTFEELRTLPGMSQGQVRRHGKALLRAVERGLLSEPVKHRSSPRPDEQYLYRLDRLRQWRKATALKLGVKSDVVLSRDLLYTIADKNPRGSDELREVLQDVPWRLEHFGSQILQVLSGKKAGNLSD